MKIVKKSIDAIERVYAVSFQGLGTPKKLLAASEGYGACKVYDLPGNLPTVVENNPGGTTDLCAHPWDESVFFAINHFTPVFQAQDAKLVSVKEERGVWSMRTIRDIPFLHRFDVFGGNGRLYFAGATLCGSKKDKDDWSDPGKVMIGEIDPQTFELRKTRTILDGLTRNHGFTKTHFQGEECYLIAGDTGVWIVPLPEDPEGDWVPRRLFDFAVSDIAVCDLDGDGEQEIAVISPFHGHVFSIYKASGRDYREVYRRKIAFGHVLWGGAVNGIPSFILGYRQEDQKLLVIRQEGGDFPEMTVDVQCGPSQIACFQGLGCFHILSANRKVGLVDGEVALYTLFEE